MRRTLAITSFCTFLLLFAVNAATDDNIRDIKILKTNTNQNNSIDYFYALLSAALNVTIKDFGEYRFVQVDLPYSQERSLHFLNDDGILDVMHTMTNSERELSYKAIKFHC